MQSTTAFPRVIPESLAKPPVTQDDLYFIPRRIPNLHQRRDEELDNRRMPKLRKDSVNPFEQANDSVSFKRPIDIRYEPEIQELSFAREAQQLQFMSPVMIPDNAPLMQIENGGEFYRGFAPTNTTFIPVTAPMINQSGVAQSLPQNAIRYIHPRNFVYSSGYYQVQQNEMESEVPRIAESFKEESQYNYISSLAMQPKPKRNKQQEQPLEQQKIEVIIKEEPGSSKGAKATQEKVGTLDISERRKKIQRYLEKRQKRIWQKKISYDCRKKVADKRLRVKGRFVTREQAFDLIGITEENLAKNESLKALIESNKDYSIITRTQDMKIRNIQKLLSAPSKEEEEIVGNLDKQVESNVVDEAKQDDNKELQVVILNKDLKDNVIEIRIDNPCKESEQISIESLLQKDVSRNGMLPEIRHPIFRFTVVPSTQCHPEHSKYHNQLD